MTKGWLQHLHREGSRSQKFQPQTYLCSERDNHPRTSEEGGKGSQALSADPSPMQIKG